MFGAAFAHFFVGQSDVIVIVFHCVAICRFSFAGKCTENMWKIYQVSMEMLMGVRISQLAGCLFVAWTFGRATNAGLLVYHRQRAGLPSPACWSTITSLLVYQRQFAGLAWAVFIVGAGHGSGENAVPAACLVWDKGWGESARPVYFFMGPCVFILKKLYFCTAFLHGRKQDI